MGVSEQGRVYVGVGWMRSFDEPPVVHVVKESPCIYDCLLFPRSDELVDRVDQVIAT